MPLSEYRLSTVSAVSKVRFGLVVSTVWIGSEYGFVTLLDESASESHTQNSTRTAPYFLSSCKNHPAAKGGRQKGIGKKVTKNVKK